jgi:hypothetical protein
MDEVPEGIKELKLNLKGVKVKDYKRMTAMQSREKDAPMTPEDVAWFLDFLDRTVEGGADEIPLMDIGTVMQQVFDALGNAQTGQAAKN